MADGSIKISVEVDGKQVDVVAKQLDNLQDAGNRTGKGIKATESSIDSLSDSGAKAGKSLKGTESAIDGVGDSGSDASKSVKGAADSLGDFSTEASQAANNASKAKQETSGVGQESNKASMGIGKLTASLGLLKIASSAFNVLKSSMDSAISRFDTLNAFPKVLQALGVSADDAEQAMTKLGDGIDGLPTLLNDIAGNAQRMYTSFNDMDKAADTAIALNNALLGSGSSAAQAQRGFDQYIKALQTGTVDMNLWNTLSETMDVGLIKIAEGFGYAGKSAKDDLYKALQDGQVSLDAFNDKLIEVGTGTGIMAELARENSLGIATSFGNLRNSASRGMANIIDAFDRMAIELTGKDIAQNIDGLKDTVNLAFNLITKAIESSIPYVKGFGEIIKAITPVVKALSPVLIGLGTAYAIHSIIHKTSEALKNSERVTKLVTLAKKLYALAMTESTNRLIASTIAEKAHAIAMTASNGILKVSTLLYSVMTGATSALAAAKLVAAGAAKALGIAWQAMLGPVGWITLAIGALAGAVVGLIKWFKRSTEEGERLKAETEELEGATNELSDSIDSSSKAYQDNQTQIQATADKNRDLANKVDELAGKENKSAAEKALLQSHIESLNGSIEGLNLAYDAEADALNMSSEEMQARINLMEEQEKVQEAQERYNEIIEEQSKVQQHLNEVLEQQREVQNEGNLTKGEAKDQSEKLAEQEDELREKLVELSDQQKETEEQIKSSMEAITKATEEGINNQVIDFTRLSESQQETVNSLKEKWQEYKDSATDMFDTLSDEVELTATDMRENLEENQRIIGEWSENIAELAERGVDEGLLETLREAGPESAGHVNALVDASDDELEKLSNVFSEGGQTATDALSKALGIEETGIVESVELLVSATEKSLSQQVKEANFPGIGEDITDGAAEGVEKGTPNVEDATRNMAIHATDEAKDALGVHSPSTVFKEIGTNVTEGLVLGVNQGASKVTQAVQQMFNQVLKNSAQSFNNITKSYENAVNQIDRSLSRLPQITQKNMTDMSSRIKTASTAQINALKVMTRNYDREVNNIDKSFKKLVSLTQKSMSNMLNRLKSGANSQTKTMRNLSKSILSQFNGTPNSFRSIGTNAMNGLNQGLLSGRARVLANARSIANQVASTMRSALRIHSPSRVMRDDVGFEISDGVAVGMFDGLSEIKKALKAMNDMVTTGAMLGSTPEMALGISSGAMRLGHSTVNNYSNFGSSQSPQTVTNHNQPTIHIEKIENYSDTDIPKILEESAWIMSREEKRL